MPVFGGGRGAAGLPYGCGIGGIGFAKYDFAFGRGIDRTSSTVDKEVPAVVRLEATELSHVRLEKPLESDCRGAVDLGWGSERRSLKPLLI